MHLIDVPSRRTLERVMAWALPLGAKLIALEKADSDELAQLTAGSSGAEHYSSAIEQFVSSRRVQYPALSVVVGGRVVFEIDMQERAAIVADSVAAELFGRDDAVRLVQVDVFDELDGARAFVDGVEESLDHEEFDDHVRSFFDIDAPSVGEEYAALLCGAVLVTDLAGETVGTLVAGRVDGWADEIRSNPWLMARARDVILEARMTELQQADIDLRERILDMCVDAQRRLR